MTARRGFTAAVGAAAGLLLALGLAATWAGPTDQRSGRVHWNAWALTWELTDSQGLKLRDVTFDGRPVLREASLPVIRVRSTVTRPWWHPSTWWPVSELSAAGPGGRCGPFQHRIGWNRSRPVPSCGDGPVCIDSYFSSHVEWLELGVLAELGAQHVYQSWHLSEDGQLTAGLQTRGQLCRTEHAHHVYWRFTFLDQEPGTYQVYAHEHPASESPGGTGWRRYIRETDAVRSGETNRTWFVRNGRTGSGVWIIPGPRDGTPDAFSDRDLSIRVHKEAESGAWVFGAREDLGFEEGEALDRAGVDVWYIAHRRHPVQDSGHSAPTMVGPTLRVQP